MRVTQNHQEALRLFGNKELMEEYFDLLEYYKSEFANTSYRTGYFYESYCFEDLGTLDEWNALRDALRYYKNRNIEKLLNILYNNYSCYSNFFERLEILRVIKKKGLNKTTFHADLLSERDEVIQDKSSVYYKKKFFSDLGKKLPPHLVFFLRDLGTSNIPFVLDLEKYTSELYNELKQWSKIPIKELLTKLFNKPTKSSYGLWDKESYKKDIANFIKYNQLGAFEKVEGFKLMNVQFINGSPIELIEPYTDDTTPRRVFGKADVGFYEKTPVYGKKYGE